MISAFVVIATLLGGLDGLKTMASWAKSAYHKYRPELTVKPRNSAEDLVLIAGFNNSNAEGPSDIRSEIAHALVSDYDTESASNMRIEQLADRLDGAPTADARELAARYNASVLIWGSETGFRVTVHLLRPDNRSAVGERALLDQPRYVFNEQSEYLEFVSESFAPAVAAAVFNELAFDHLDRDEVGIAGEYVQLAMRAINSAPDEIKPSIYFNAGYVALNADNNELAVEHFSSALALSPEDINSLTDRAIAYTRLNLHDEAIRDMNQAVEIDPSSTISHTNLGVILRRAGRPSDAIDEYNLAIQLGAAEAVTAYGNRALAYKDLGEFDLALTDLDKAISLADDEASMADAYYNRGLVKNEAGSYESAIDDFRKALEIDPDRAEVYADWGVSYHRMGREDEALERLSKSLQIKPTSIAFSNRGGVYLDINEPNKALQDLEAAIEMDPLLVPAYSNRAIALIKLHQEAEALADLDRVIELEPSEASGYLDRGIYYSESGWHELAMADLERAVSIDPSYDALYARGLELLLIGENQRAFDDLSAALLTGQSSVSALINRGVSLRRLGRLTEATSDYSRAIELAPDSVVAYQNRANVYVDLKQFKDAAEDFTEVIRLNSLDADAFAGRGRAYRCLGKVDQASNDLRQAIDLQKGDNANDEFGDQARLVRDLRATQMEQLLFPFGLGC